MSNQPSHESSADAENPGSQDVANPSRRRLGKLGATSAAVMLSVPSRSAVAGWGTCTGSELASGNLSRAATANPCGCSPGYWWNSNGMPVWQGAASWKTPAPLPTAMFNQVFGVAFFKPDVALSKCGPASSNPKAPAYSSVNNNTAMHAIAALLNAAYFGSRFPVPANLQTPAGVIAAFKSACMQPNPKQALAAFVSSVDVYSSKSTWCFGGQH